MYACKYYLQAAEQIKRLYKFFLSVDSTQVEINPFGETPQGEVVCFDAKISFDDNAEFRQKQVRTINLMLIHSFPNTLVELFFT